MLGFANVVSKYLQKSEIDLNQAGVLVQELIKKVEEYRSDEAFDVIFEASSVLCVESEVEPKFGMPSARKPKRRTGEIIKRDGPISDPVLRFKVEFYFATNDKLLSALKERFEDFFEVVSMFDILSPAIFVKPQQ